jgi:hypothetical protein
MSIKLCICFLAASLAFFSPLFSQTAIRSVEEEDPTAIVAAPYFYLDYLKTKTDGWLNEAWDTTTGNWMNSELVKSYKDAGGRFTELETQVWWSNKWIDNFNATHQYMLDGNNRLTEIQSKIYGENLRTELYYNTSGNLVKVSYFYKGNPYSDCFFFYNSLGQRIADTMRYTGSYAVDVQTYDYNAGGKCTLYIAMKVSQVSADTLAIEEYAYSGNQLTRITKIASDFMGRKPYSRIDFDYSGTNIKQVVFNDYDTAQQPYQATIYKHYYTGATLTGITKIEAPNGPSPQGDSITFTYNAKDQLDTGYLYNLLGTAWQPLASNRFTFSKLNTGIEQLSRPSTTLVYPNPFADYISVKLNAAFASSISLVITDVSGRYIKTVTENINAGENSIKIPMSDLAAGIYYLTNGTSAVKLVKQ